MTYFKRTQSVKQKRWRDKRTAADPGFRLRALERCRVRYVRRRLAAGKTPRPRAPRATERGRLDTFLLFVLTRQGRFMPRLKMFHEYWSLPVLRQRLAETAGRLMETVKRKFRG